MPDSRRLHTEAKLCNGSGQPAVISAYLVLSSMKASTPKIDWPRTVQQMAADKARLEAAIRGSAPARQEVTFAHPLAVPAK